MKLYAILLLGSLLLPQAPACGAQAPKPEDAQPMDAMTSFRFVTGTWKPVADPAKPSKYDETYTFAPILEGRFLVSQEIYRDKDGKIFYHDFAVFGVDPDTHKLFLHAYNTDGSIDRTRGVDSKAGEWVFEGRVFGSARFRDYRYTITRIDDEHMRVLIELMKDGKYEQLSETRYQRKSKEASTQIQ
jgi:hypothetical protein